ncbi:MAG: SAM-dependent methyltransferase [Leptonema sp. (in: bacteria)]
MLPKIQKILYLVGTPIGNLEDITIRALKILKQSDLILAESFRSITTLLKYHKIDYNQENIIEYDQKKVTLEEIKDFIINSNTLSYVSDAGMPVFMDPGEELIYFCQQHQFEIKVIPGVSSLTTALVYSGLNGSFYFAGFPPRETFERIQFIKKLNQKPIPVVLFETPFRTRKLLEECKKFLNNEFYISILMNLTTEKEKIINTKIKEVHKYFSIIEKEPVVIIIKNDK